MASTIRTGPKTNPYAMYSKQAEGALAENSFVKKGTTDDEVQPIATSDNEAAIGFVDRAYADDEMVSVLSAGNIVDCECDGTVALGDEVVTGDAVGSVQTVANFNPANNGTVNIVGRCVFGNTDGKRCKIELDFRSYIHGE